MAKDREITCIHYVCRGTCDLGRDAEFYGICQTCKNYKPNPRSKPARVDSRKKKLDKIQKKEAREYN